MKPGSMPRDASSLSLHAWAIAVIAAAALGGAWFFQLVLGIQPCPLCLEQRYAYYLAIPLAIVVAIAAARHAPRSLLYLGLAVLAVAALGNAVGTAHQILDLEQGGQIERQPAIVERGLQVKEASTQHRQVRGQL